MPNEPKAPALNAQRRERRRAGGLPCAIAANLSVSPRPASRAEKRDCDRVDLRRASRSCSGRSSGRQQYWSGDSSTGQRSIVGRAALIAVYRRHSASSWALWS